MAIMNQGILGGLSGKVGQVIGASWRGINYLRIYAIPSNPQTEAQTTQRSKFSLAVRLAKSCLSSICHKFWENVYPQMSGFNAFVKNNITYVDPVTLDFKDCVFSNGALEIIPITAATYTTLTGAVSITYTSTVTGDGQSTDKVALIVYDCLNNVSYINDSALTRATGTGALALPAGLTAAKLFVYGFAYRGTAPNYYQSPTTGFGAITAV